MVADSLLTLDDYRSRQVKRLVLSVAGEDKVAEMLSELPQLLGDYQGGSCPISVRYRMAETQTELRLGDEWRVRPTTVLMQSLKALLGEDMLTIEY